MIRLSELRDVFRARPADDAVYGFGGHDDITGSGQIDTLFGGSGNDYLKGLAGNDILIGGSGNDTIRADAGDDMLYGGTGGDTLYGSAGDDTIFDGGTNGADMVYGGEGNDRLFSEGVGFAGGGLGDDVITASVIGTGQVHILGQQGDDVLNLDMRNDAGTQGHHVYGGSGADTFAFSNLGAANLLSIGRIDDFDASVDQISVGGVMVHGSGAHLSDLPSDIRVDGVGTVRVQIVEYAQPSMGSIDLGTQQFLTFGEVTSSGVEWLGFYALEGARRNGPDQEEVHFANMGMLTSGDIDGMKIVRYEDQKNFVPDQLVPDLSYEMLETQDQTISGTDGHDNIFAEDNSNPTLRENLIYGGSGDDVINSGKAEDIVFGGNGNDMIAGGLDNDILSGGVGNDSIYGGSEDDLIYGGRGHDLLEGGGEDDVIHGQSGRDKLSGGSGDDKLFGGSWSDTLYGGSGNDRLNGGQGDDVVWAGGGNDKLFGGSGNDDMRGWGGRDHMVGGSGDDRMDGGNQNDWLYGGGGDDDLIGGRGNDVLRGGSGDDTLAGGLGNDVLEGGDGADVYAFDADQANGTDQINGFALGQDKIAFSQNGNGLTFDDIFLSQDDSDAIIKQGDTTIRVKDVDADDLDEDDFLF